MLYLIAASWEWLAGAAALGLVVGALAVTTEKGARSSGYWIAPASALLLVGCYFVCNLQIVPGRAGLYFDLGLLFVSAYGLALPIGGGARLLAGAGAPPAPARKKPPHVVLRGAPKTAPEAAPQAVAEPAAAAPSIPEESEPAAPVVATAPAAKPKLAPAAAEAPKKHPGARPEGLPGPRGGKPDDLSKIKGVGPKSVEKLHALGVYHFDQIAAWTPENVKWVSASFAIPGRLERGRWVAQAKELAEGARPQERRAGGEA